jgi:tRNA(adenine34) deaminase
MLDLGTNDRTSSVSDDADAGFMRQALALARAAERTAGFGDIGCVIVMDGRVIGQSSNEAEARHDPTAHAEILAIRQASEALQTTELRGATLYSTLQPCGMCSMASIWARVGRIVYGAQRHQVHESYFEGRHLDTMDFINDAFRDDLSVVGGVLGEECAQLYYAPGDRVPLADQTNI